MLRNDAVQVPNDGALDKGAQFGYVNGLEKIVPRRGLHGLVNVIEVVVPADHAEHGLHAHGAQMLGQLISPVIAQVDINRAIWGWKSTALLTASA